MSGAGKAQATLEDLAPREVVTELRVKEGSQLAGKSLREVEEALGVKVLGRRVRRSARVGKLARLKDA